MGSHEPDGTASRKGLATVLGCGAAAQHMMGRNHVCAKSYRSFLKDSFGSLRLAMGQDSCPIATTQKLILRQRAPQISSLGSPELSLGSQQLHRV